MVVLPVRRSDGEACLYRLQVTTSSALGALALESGGVVVDGGWLRLLGGGAEGLVSLAVANDLEARPSHAASSGKLIVGIDVVGGRFAINGGRLPGPVGEVCYFGPDTLCWEPLQLGHGAFVEWALKGDVDGFYETFRWSGWREDVGRLSLDQVMQAWPPPFTSQGRPPNEVSRRPVPWREATDFLDLAAEQLASLPDGEPFRITTTEEEP